MEIPASRRGHASASKGLKAKSVVSPFKLLRGWKIEFLYEIPQILNVGNLVFLSLKRKHCESNHACILDLVHCFELG